MQEAKSFTISKQLVWQAWLKVKANQGAAGVDGQTIEGFEKDLKDNLYKIWNRMSSGSYMPKAVKLVEIPKNGGGKRPLGIPKLLSYYLFLQFALGMFRYPIWTKLILFYIRPDNYGRTIELAL